MKALVTGGAGFVGHHLVNYILYNTDWDVIILDKLSYASRGFDRLRESGILQNERVKVLTHDLANPMSDGLEREIGAWVDFVFHLAAESHVDNSIHEPMPFVMSNVVGTVQLLDWLKCRRDTRFIYMSTDEVFGEAREETHPPFHPDSRHRPRNPYAASKSAGEQMVVAYDNSYNNINAQIVHCMNVFGARQHPEKFIPKVIKLILEELPVDVYTDANGVMGSRIYIHADDVAHALVELAQQKKDDLKYNIRGVTEIKNDEMVRIIATVLDRNENMKEVSFDLGDSSHDLRYDIAGTVGIPTTEEEFDEQLKDTILWTASHQQWLESDG